MKRATLVRGGGLVIMACLLLASGCGDPIESAIKQWNLSATSHGVNLKDPRNVRLLIVAVNDSFSAQAHELGFESGFAAVSLSVVSQVHTVSADEWAKWDAQAERGSSEFRSLYRKWKSTIQSLQDLQKKQQG